MEIIRSPMDLDFHGVATGLQKDFILPLGWWYIGAFRFWEIICYGDWESSLALQLRGCRHR